MGFIWGVSKSLTVDALKAVLSHILLMSLKSVIGHSRQIFIVERNGSTAPSSPTQIRIHVSICNRTAIDDGRVGTFVDCDYKRRQRQMVERRRRRVRRVGEQSAPQRRHV